MPVADTSQRDSSTGGNTVIFVRAPSASDVEGPRVSKDQTDANPATEDGSQAEPALPLSTKPAGLGPAALGPPGTPRPAAQPRLYFIDWLRVFLTVAVLVHHTIVMYCEGLHEAGQYPRQHPDFSSMAFDYAITGFNQAYFMGLFYLLSGYFSTGSYTRKGLRRYIQDRAIRLLIPIAFFDLLLGPIIFMIAKAGGVVPEKLPGLAETNNVWTWYFRRYRRVASNPTWFLMALFLFDCCYAAFRVLLAKAAALNSTAADLQAKLTIRPATSTQPQLGQPFTNHYLAAALLVLLLVLGAVTFALRVPFSIIYSTPLVFSFKLGYFGQYVIAYCLGIAAYLGNSLMRLPKRFGYCCLCIGLVWYIVGCLIILRMVGVSLSSASGGGEPKALNGAVLGSLFGGAHPHALFTAMWEQSFALLWSVGLVVVAREHVNMAPQQLGKVVIGAAYAVYIIHPLFLCLYGMAFGPLESLSPIARVVVTAPLVVVSSWVLGAGLKTIPYADRVL